MGFRCGYCVHDDFLSFEDMKQHILTSHPDVQQRRPSGGDHDDRLFRCFPCHLSFSSELKLQLHLRTEHRRASSAPSSPDTDTAQISGGAPSGSPWVCNVCQKQFPFQSRLKRHAIIHDVQQQRKYQCQMCEKRFLRSGDLWAHTKIHQQKKYECGVCGKKLAHSGSWHNHKLSCHSQDKRFQCPICQKKFSLKQKLAHHQSHVHPDRPDS